MPILVDIRSKTESTVGKMRLNAKTISYKSNVIFKLFCILHVIISLFSIPSQPIDAFKKGTRNSTVATISVIWTLRGGGVPMDVKNSLCRKINLKSDQKVDAKDVRNIDRNIFLRKVKKVKKKSQLSRSNPCASSRDEMKDAFTFSYTTY